MEIRIAFYGEKEYAVVNECLVKLIELRDREEKQREPAIPSFHFTPVSEAVTLPAADRPLPVTEPRTVIEIGTGPAPADAFAVLKPTTATMEQTLEAVQAFISTAGMEKMVATLADFGVKRVGELSPEQRADLIQRLG